jgi:enoyl-CoA hydratase
MTASDTEVTISRPTDQVSVITLNRPARLNAMTATLVSELHDALDAASIERGCRVLVLTGAGRGFCAGLDLGGFGPMEQESHKGPVQRDMAAQKHIAALPSHLRSLPQPVIAAVNGPATGGGLALVLASDIRLCAQSARFNAAFVRIGLSGCDIGTSWLLPRIVGAARAQELMLTGRLIDAEEALRIGLVTHVTPDENLMDAALAKADEIISNAPSGVQMTKEAMWIALEIPGMQAAIELENRQQVLLARTEDHAEALRAFLEKRAPHFKEG